MARTFDVWVQSSNTIYKKVPFDVVTQWAQQGRLTGTDKLRPGGSEAAWTNVTNDATIADFLFAKKKSPVKAVVAGTVPPIEAAAMDAAWDQKREEEDDDVDMIPLIDISLVLLIFFMMTAVTSALSPIDVPQMKNAFEISTAGEAVTIVIDKRPSGDISYGLRIGEHAPEAGDGDLDTLALLTARLDERLAENAAKKKSPPEVRFACHRDLPSERVHDLVKELETRRKAGKISLYRAEVNEKK